MNETWHGGGVSMGGGIRCGVGWMGETIGTRNGTHIVNKLGLWTDLLRPNLA